MIWRWLADWCVPAKALRWGKHPPFSLAMLDTALRYIYEPVMRQQINAIHPFFADLPPYRPNPWSFYDRTGLTLADDTGDEWE